MLIILVIVLPIVRKSNAMDDSSSKSIPRLDNTNLWAHFPGELSSTINHKFQVVEYSDNLNTATIKDSIDLTEEVKYDNFNYSESEDKMYFDAKSEFKVEKQETKNEKINTLNMGLFETLETISNPQDYQLGINSIQYLLNKAFQSPDSFIRHLFSEYYFKNDLQDKTKVLETILKDVESTKANKILSSDSEYSFAKVSGFYQWVKILAIPYSITKATWLTTVFDLTEAEINSVLGKEQYLNEQYIAYNQKLAKDYECEDEKVCGFEIIYTQLISGKVTKDVDASLDSLKSLYNLINKDYYPFDKSPELNLYFEEFKNEINKPDAKYETYSVSKKQLSKIIGLESQLTILASNNSALFLALVQSKDDKTLLEKYTLTLEQSTFLCYYFYQYLPKLFLYREFKEQDKTYTVTPIAKAFSTITQNLIGQTYYQLSNHQGLYNLLLSKLVWRGLHFKLLNFSMEYEDEDICPLIMQHALDDGRKVLKICSDPTTSFNSPYTLSKWFAPYYCVKSGDESKCDMTIINHLKSIVYITEDEIKAIYSKDFLGDLIEENDKALKEAYQCGDECDNDYLAKMQFWKSYVTLNAPVGIEKCDTISQIFPDEFPYPVELYYYAKNYTTEEIKEEDVDYLISLSPKSDDILEEDSYEAFNNRFDLEKEYTLYIENKKNDQQSRYKLIDLFTNGYLYGDKIENEYENIDHLLQGNNVEDLRFIRYLSNGKYYDNFKPGYNKTTGLDFGINLETKEKTYVDYDRYSINTKDDKLRRIASINDCPILNIKKKEYNCLSKSYTNIVSPILNLQSLTEDKSFTDGFQYDHEKDSIYYYDRISSRPFKFEFKEEVDIDDQTCRKYELDKGDLSSMNEKGDLDSGKAFISQKLNKPFVITAGKDGLNDDLSGKISDENYICIEPFSNMVVDSKINLVYSLYTKQFGFLFSKIPNEKVYPLFLYSKLYKVQMSSFNSVFPEIDSYRDFRNTFIIVGIIFIVIFFCVSVFCFYKWKSEQKPLIQMDKNGPKISLINASTSQSGIKNDDEEGDN
jgi:hypothetical protein